MYNLPSKWTTFEETLFKRILDGVYSASVLLGEIPEIRYLNNSPLCRNIAFALERRLMDSNPVELLMYGNNNNSDINSNIEHNGNTVIVILDRREDPITPLLTQWTYQSMIHELITIKQNKITIGSEEYTLSEEYDNFYDEHKYDNFGDIGFFIRDMVNQQELNNNYCKNLNSIDDINRFIDTYPEFKKESGIVCKHVNIMHKLSEIVQNRELMRISALEQDIFVNDNIIEHSKEVGSILDDPKIDTFDKIRLALIYSLKYQENEMQINNFKYNLGNNSKYIDKLLEIAGKDFRSIDLFQSKSLFNIAKNTIRKTAGGTVNENIYIQHKTLMYSLLENLVKGKLKYSRFPSTDDSNTTKKPQKVMVFIVGGVTYEEVRDANEIKNLYDVDIILGGTDIINSKSFIDDIDLLTNS
ncbi:vacuolar -sorting VPS45 [Cryptosporidium bovis]|uniref:vacuolar -sorting VPS45 n=1 Tax=Cryptosporidium bovis TaxID=310047 RepID=UPI003519DF2E|nr:vacuolar -sorting VPS45 [Cryptosporidium bovis]